MNAAEVALPDSFKDKIRPPDPDCWMWQGAADKYGYGKAWYDGRDCKAHRVVYELLVGPIPDGLVLDHLCRNRLCVNPEHLEPVTIKTNLERGWGLAGFRRTHCARGHELTPENSKPNGSGKRTCRACVQMRDRVRPIETEVQPMTG